VAGSCKHVNEPWGSGAMELVILFYTPTYALWCDTKERVHFYLLIKIRWKMFTLIYDRLVYNSVIESTRMFWFMSDHIL
jgi:hypothetical protein